MATEATVLNLNDAAVLVVDSGNFFSASPGTPEPTDPLTVLAPWKGFGHTSLEEIMSISSEGGEATTIGTLQKPQLRTRYSDRTETIALTLQQFDVAGLRMYYGSNAPILPNGKVGNPAKPIPTVAAFFGVFVDGDNHFSLYAPKAEIFRRDDLSIADTESLSSLPIGVKPMLYGANTWTYAVSPLGDAPILPTGATAGTPGVYTPEGAVMPADISGLAGVAASPSTKWAEGEYIVLGDNTEAHWTGTAWDEGRAAA